MQFRHFDKVGIAALDTALWDLAGKKYGASISQLLGGYRERLPTYASTTPGQETPGGLDSIEKYADFAEECQQRGFPAFKIHGFFDGDVDNEIGIMTAVRDRVGSTMKLMTDPASSLGSFMDAVEVGRACDDLGFLWYEDPYRDASSSAAAHKRLRDFVRTPMLIAEHIRGFEQKADFVLARGTDIMHVDPELDGGITGTMKLAHFCDAIGMEVQLHTAGPMHRHCMSAIPNTLFYELGLVNPDTSQNCLQPPIYADGYGDGLDDVGADGCVAVPTGSGLGVEYDWDKINAWKRPGARSSTLLALPSQRLGCRGGASGARCRGCARWLRRACRRDVLNSALTRRTAGGRHGVAAKARRTRRAGRRRSRWPTPRRIR